MGLLEALHESCIRVGSDAADKVAVLREIAGLAKESPVLSQVDENAIYEALSSREEIHSTGFGHGIAIPHCAFDKIESFIVGILVHARGVAFDSLDGKPTHIFAFIIGPMSKRNEHIRLLSEISRVLHDEDTVKQLLAAGGPAAVRERFLQPVAGQPDRKGQTETDRSLFHVAIQDEEKFDDILQVFSEMDECSVSVVEANDVTQYLHALPLFAGFLSDKRKGYHRIIIATVRKSLANEALRQITMVTGDLDAASGVMVAMQELSFCSGSLNY